MHHLPPATPDPIALDQWQQLARVSGNLNQIAAVINSARLAGAVFPDLADIRGVLVGLRSALLNARDSREDAEWKACNPSNAAPVSVVCCGMSSVGTATITTAPVCLLAAT